MEPKQLWQVLETTEYKGVEIRKVVIRLSYPRNGNCHNPSYQYEYWGFLSGKCIASHKTLKGIKSNIDEERQNP